MSERNVLLTGAPATGKTTIYQELLDRDFGASPPHMTRPIRVGEIEGVHGIFVERRDFEENLAGGLYFEKTVEQSLYSANNECYGCPESWSDEMSEGERCLAVVPTSIFAATCLARKLASRHPDVPVAWLHLYATEEERAQRMQERGGVTPGELAARLRRGDSHSVPPSELATVIDTGGLSPTEVLRVILKITNRR